MLNVVALQGRLVADPINRATANGTSVASFRLAVDRSYADANGQRQADFFDVVAWRGTADFVTKYFRKGSMIAIDGQLQSRQYQDRNGNNRVAIEVVAHGVHFCGGKADGARQPEPASAANMQPPAKPQPAPVTYAAGDNADFAPIADDEDLPF